MASTYSNTGIELIADGEQSGTWGQTTNTNWQLIEELATGVVAVALTATTHTLTTSDGASSVGRHAVVVFTGSPGGTCTVTVSPNDMQKIYFIKNDADEDVIMSQGSGANVTVASGTTQIIYCDGGGATAAVYALSGSVFNTLTATTGVITNGSFTSITLGGTAITATAAELNLLDGVTATTAELNILDGLTATTAELNVLDGITSSTAELNILDGVTSTAAELNLLDGATANTVVNSKAVIYGSAGEVQASSIDFGDWTISESSGTLVFSHSGTAKFQITSAGEITAADDVIAYGSL